MPNGPKALTVLIKEHCSIEGETLGNFMAELKKLNEADKAWFRAEFVKMGFEIQ